MAESIFGWRKGDDEDSLVWLELGQAWPAESWTASMAVVEIAFLQCRRIAVLRPIASGPARMDIHKVGRSGIVPLGLPQ